MSPQNGWMATDGRRDGLEMPKHFRHFSVAIRRQAGTVLPLRDGSRRREVRHLSGWAIRGFGVGRFRVGWSMNASKYAASAGRKFPRSSESFC